MWGIRLSCAVRVFSPVDGDVWSSILVIPWACFSVHILMGDPPPIFAYCSWMLGVRRRAIKGPSVLIVDEQLRCDRKKQRKKLTFELVTGWCPCPRITDWESHTHQRLSLVHPYSRAVFQYSLNHWQTRQSVLKRIVSKYLWDGYCSEASFLAAALDATLVVERTAVFEAQERRISVAEMTINHLWWDVFHPTVR